MRKIDYLNGYNKTNGNMTDRQKAKKNYRRTIAAVFANLKGWSVETEQQQQQKENEKCEWNSEILENKKYNRNNLLKAASIFVVEIPVVDIKKKKYIESDKRRKIHGGK